MIELCSTLPWRNRFLERTKIKVGVSAGRASMYRRAPSSHTTRSANPPAVIHFTPMTRAPPRPRQTLGVVPAAVRKKDVRLPVKGNSNSHGARPVHLITMMIELIRTSSYYSSHTTRSANSLALIHPGPMTRNYFD